VKRRRISLKQFKQRIASLPRRGPRKSSPWHDVLEKIASTQEAEEIVCSSPQEAGVVLLRILSMREKNNYQIVARRDGATVLVGPGEYHRKGRSRSSIENHLNGLP